MTSSRLWSQVTAPPRLLAASALAALVGCEPLPVAPTPFPVFVQIDEPAARSVEEGDSLRLRAQVFDQRGEPIPSASVTWSVDPDSVAAIGAEGWLRAVTPGAFLAYARAEGAVALLPLEVLARPWEMTLEHSLPERVPVAQSVQVRIVVMGRRGEHIAGVPVTFRPDSLSGEVLAAGAAPAAPAAAPSASRAASRGAAEVVVVSDADGVATATWVLGTGVLTARLFVSHPRIQQPLTIEVQAVAGSPATLAPHTEAEVDARAGAAVEVAVRLTDEFGNPAAGQEVSWDARDGSEADPTLSVTGEDGVAHTRWTLGSEPGAYTLRAAGFGFTQEFHASVTPGELARIRISRTNVLFERLGETRALSATGYDAFGNALGPVSPSWRSTDARVASVDDDGVVAAVGAGQALVTASYEGFRDTVQVSVELDEPAPHTAPAAPSLTVGGVGPTTATLHGSAFSDADGDAHQASHWQVDVAGGDFSAPAFDSGETTTDLSSLAVTGLDPATPYKARVRYLDGGGLWSEWSAPAAFTTTAAPHVAPATPTLSVSGVGSTTATLHGSAFSDADGDAHQASHWQVDVQGADFSTPAFDSGETTTDLTSLAVTALDPATPYKARVRYLDGEGLWSEWSAFTAFTTTAVPQDAPATPTLAIGAVTATGATLSGSAFSDPDGDAHQTSQWQVDEQGGNWNTPVATSGMTASDLVSWSATGLTAATAYQARVRYQDARGEWSDWSAVVPFTTVNTPPRKPTLGVGTITPTSVVLTGDAFSDADGHAHQASEWQVDEQGGDWSTPVFASGATTADLLTRTATGLAGATDYQARVRYRDEFGQWSDWSEDADFTTANTPPAQPTLGVASITSTGAVLNGSAYSDVEGDAHQASEWQVDGQGENWDAPVFASGTTTTDLTSRTVSGLLAGTDYQARMRYQDARGDWSEWSATVDFSTTRRPAQPILSVGSIAVDGATLRGDAFSDADGHAHQASEWQIEALDGDPGNDWTILLGGSGATPDDLLTRDIAGLAAFTAHQARVRYQDGNGEWSDWSATVDFTTDPAAGASLFTSNWGTALGTGDGAVRDGPGATPTDYAWNRSFCSDMNVLNVVEGAPLGWTATPNVLEVTETGESDCRQVARDPIAGLPEGSDYFVRLYVRNDAEAANAQFITNHPVVVNVQGFIQSVLWSNHGTGVGSGTYRMRASWGATNTNGGAFGNGDLYWGPPVLNNGVWYRFEWWIEFVNVRANEADVRLWPRVYDDAGTLLYDVDDFRRSPGWGGDPNETLQQWYDGGGLVRYTNLSTTRNLGVGYEGPAGRPATGLHWYYAGVEVRNQPVAPDEWVGPLP